MRLIAGLDVGTTGCKVTVFTAEGENLGREYRDYPVRRAVDAQEVDAVALGESVLACVKAAKSRFGKIDALGVTSFGEAFVLADEGGRPLRPVILCTDPRGADECRELCEKVGERRIASIVGVRPHSMYSLPKLMWIRNHEPEVFAKAKSAMLIEDYAIFLLTGQRKTDHSCATRTMAFDIRMLDWSDEILNAAGMPRSMFSEPIPPGSVAGVAEDGMKVIAAAHDQVAAAVGAGVFEPGMAADGAGTVECVTPMYERIPEDEAFVANNYNVVPYFGRYVTYAYSYTGGALVDWATRLLGRGHSELQQGEYRPTGLLVLPHFAGAATPYMDSGSRGAAVGLTLATTPQDLYFACLEGVAYEMRLNRDRLAESGVRYNRLVATGGGAKSRVWTQIKADVLGVPVVSLETEDSGTVGCAMLAGVAAGVFRNLAEAQKAMVREIGSFTPNPARSAEYDAIYTRYEKMYNSIRPLVEEVK